MTSTHVRNFSFSLSSRESRDERGEKVRRLKSELESKMADWRRQVMSVQAASLAQAEEKSHETLRARRTRVSSQNRERERRHSRRRTKVDESHRVAERESRRAIEEKREKVERIQRERDAERARSRAKARKIAEIREKLR